MAKGMSLHIGVNRVDPSHYAGWDKEIYGPNNDANYMCKLLNDSQQRFEHKLILINEEATYEMVTSNIRKIAGELDNEGLFILTFSGHGGLLRDFNDDEEKIISNNKMDQTWCLFNKQLVDDELYELLGKFKPGVRIFVVSDSCHSGSVISLVKLNDALKSERAIKEVPIDILEETYRNNRSYYDSILNRQYPDKSSIKASIKLLSACKDDQQTPAALYKDGCSQFTEILKNIWDLGCFKGNYHKFYVDVKNKMKNLILPQVPNFLSIGPNNEKFNDEKPFKI